MPLGWITETGSLGSYSMGSNVSVQLIALPTDPTVTYSIVAGTLPSGLTLTGATGVVSGSVPTVPTQTTFTFTVRANDPSSATYDRAFTVTVNSPPILVPPVKVGWHIAGGQYTTNNELMTYSTETWGSIANQMPHVNANGGWGATFTDVFHCGGHIANYTLSFDVLQFTLSNSNWVLYPNQFSGTCHSSGHSLYDTSYVYLICGGAWNAPTTSECDKISMTSGTGTALANAPAAFDGRTQAGNNTNGYLLHNSNTWKMVYGTDVITSIAPGYVSDKAPGGISSGINMYTMGGSSTPTSLNKFVFSSEAFSSLPGTLPYAVGMPSTSTNLVYAWVGGGSQQDTNVSKLTYSTETAIAGPSLLVASYQRTGC